jgi:hypothetical protein|tara:strand:- start:9234 stop:9695 length:462 start_codon:yes stop_codon:yes gene_type:complete
MIEMRNEKKEGDAVVSLGGEMDEANFDTRDSYLAAALMSLGIAPVGSEPVRIVTREHLSGEQYQFYFNPVSNCGKFRTREMLAAWREGTAWVEKNPDHPFAFAMAAVWNYRDLLRFIKGKAPYAWISQGRSIAMLPLDASAGLQEKILGRMGS